MPEQLASIHPIWQGVAIALALVTLRWGMSIRRSRLRESTESRAHARRWHVPLGLATVVLVTLGYLGGPVTMLWVRRQPIFQTWHAYTGTAAAFLLALGGYYGWRLKRGGQDREALRELHIFCVGLALFLILVEVIMGFPLLP